MDLLVSATNKAFPFPIFSILHILFLSSLLFFSSFIFATENNIKALPTQHQCIEDHFSALLHLKQGFNFSNDSKTRLPSWNPDNRDCCSWEGITCHGATGHVISLDLSELSISGQIDFESLFHLRSLQSLNLAYNNFNSSPVPSGFDQLTSLTHLNLSSSDFYGQIPLEISILTSLVSLDLSYNPLQLKNPNMGTLLRNLSSLRELCLDYVNISAQGSEWGPALSSLPRLRKLSLSDCYLSGPIHSSLSKLHFLSELDLSYNNPFSVVPNFMGNFSSLTSLRLSGCELQGEFPESIFRLPNLKTLDVSYNPLLTGEIPQNNTLRELRLSNGGFCSKLRDSFGNSKMLTMLALAGCNLSGPFPSWLVNLDKLVDLDLSSNALSGPLPSWLVKLDKLEKLDLSYNGLSGPIPSSYGNALPNLKELHFSNNSLNGTIPSSLFSLPSLRVLDLSINQFSGRLGELHNASSSPLEKIILDNNNLQGPIPRSIFELPKLTFLRLQSNSFNGSIPSLHENELQNCERLFLSNNSLSGTIPSSLFSLPSVRVLDLSINQFSGQLGEFHNTSSSLLEKIYLDHNNLQGPIHMSVFELTNLKCLMLSSNNFSGDVDLFFFEALKKLQLLDLSDNSFSVYDSGSNSTSISFPHIEHLSLRSCNITKFPGILKNQERLYSLDLSNNRISGVIPNWIWSIGNGLLANLNLSHNALERIEHPSPHLSSSSLEYLDLSFNMLEGLIPIPPPFIYFFSLSRNNLSGEVPLLLCNYTFLQVLDLSENYFNGSIPQCLGEVSDALTVLNLRGNAFHGTLLQTLKDGCTLETLDLNGNQLEGQVPRSLAMCKKLEVLNLGNNQIHDTFPFWLETLSQLRILILGSNKFHGTIAPPLTNHTFPLLQIFDLSSNRFVGSLPSNMFKSWKAMMEEGKSQSQFLSKKIRNGYYQDKVTIVSKGLELELVKILTAFTVIDLSSNQFHGDIPESVGDLKSLLVLNMSYNHFTGRIPTLLGNIKDLESLDLSNNNLSGKIPLQLTKLTFLEVLNLSQNFLVGSIPQGQQFNTFTDKSFLGNVGLCGPPLLKKREKAEASPPFAQSQNNYGWDWEYVCIGFGVGYGVGIGTLVWTLVLWAKGLREYTMFIDRMLLLIFPCDAFYLMHRH